VEIAAPAQVEEVKADRVLDVVRVRGIVCGKRGGRLAEAEALPNSSFEPAVDQAGMPVCWGERDRVVAGVLLTDDLRDAVKPDRGEDLGIVCSQAALAACRARRCSSAAGSGAETGGLAP